jgi:hypothetical protein
MGFTTRQFKFSRFRKAFRRFLGVTISSNPRAPRSFSRINDQEGSALVMACIFMLIAATLITVGAKLVANSQRDSTQVNLYVGEAENVARSGLVDALGYLRRNSGVKPLSAFTSSQIQMNQVPTFAINPQDPGGNPYYYVDQPFQPQINTTNAQVSDTLEPVIGIVNEYSVDSANNSTDANALLFGRYEVRKQVSQYPTPYSSPNTAATYTPNPNAAHDVTGNRSVPYQNGDGTVWTLTSVGYIYKRTDKTFANGTPTPGTTYFPGQWKVPYNQLPNRVVATAKMSSEYRKLVVNLPPGGGVTVNAAIYCYKGNNINIAGTSTQLSGAVSAAGTFGVCDIKDPSSPAASCLIPTGSNTPPNFQGGVTCLNNTVPLALADSTVFGMSVTNLQFLSDKSGDSLNPLNLANTQWGLYYYNGSVTFGFDQPAPYTNLDTTGILVVNGDLSFTGGNGGPLLLFGGIIFCTGNVSVANGTEIDGCVIMGSPYFHGVPGTVTLNGSGAAYGTINLNPNLIAQALNLVATYREDISARRTLLAVPNI